MRVLVLHGYGQDPAKIQKAVLRTLRSKENLELVIPHGGLILPDGFAWWAFPEKREDIHQPHPYHLELFRDSFLDQLGEDRTFDAIIGFSQGAVMTVIALHQGWVHAGKVVLIAGSDIQDDRYRPHHPINVDALIVMGDKDTLVPTCETVKLSKYCGGSVSIWQHRLGHVVPNDRDSRQRFRSFLEC